ncbi:hypothetical protein [Deinococcus rufus]|uniref:Uncharacterized protein n=1 Tax=Deinococcus rufus TaxID=2136097 RepID=A0ABV7ZB40_9DEIO
MTPPGRMLATGVLPLLLALLLSRVATAPQDVPAFSTMPLVPTSCTQPPTFAPGYERRPGYVVPRAGGFWFDSDAWIEGAVCTPGTLKITAEPQLGGDEPPRLTVVLDQEFLAAPAFERSTTVSVRVERPGRLLLGFFNDYYLADVRVATLRDITFTGAGCSDLTDVDVPFESAGQWFPEARVATLVRAQPMTVVPCGPGRLTMTVQGREGNHAFPVLEVRQGATHLTTIRTSLQWQPVELNLTGAPATITVTNPYGKTLANRNLTVQRLEFVPDGRPAVP